MQQAMIKKKLSRPADYDVTDAAKGLLIMFVIIGHAANFFTEEPFIFLSLKFFHVACFLMFAFVFTLHDFSKAQAQDRFIRYYMPFFWFTVLYGVLNFMLISPDHDFGLWITDLTMALTIANGIQLDAASGFKALWFLPVYLSLVFILTVLPKNVFLFVFAFVVHGLAGLVPDPIKHYVPMGLLIALYLLLPGLLLRQSLEYLKEKRASFSWLFLGLFGLFLFVSYHFQTRIKFPIIDLPGLDNSLALFTHTGIILFASLFLLTTPVLRKSKLLLWHGRHSLTLYLTHLPFMAISHLMLKKLGFNNHGMAWEMIAVLLISGASLVGGYTFIWLFQRIEFLSRLIMPRTLEDWPVSKLIPK